MSELEMAVREYRALEYIHVTLRDAHESLPYSDESRVAAHAELSVALNRALTLSRTAEVEARENLIGAALGAFPVEAA